MRTVFLFALFLSVLFLSPVFAQVYPDWLEEYFKDFQTSAGPGFAYCNTDADCKVYNYDENKCLGVIYWQPLKEVIENGKVYYVPNDNDWRLVKRFTPEHPLYKYNPGMWYSDYISVSKYRFKCVEHKCVLDREASIFEMKKCEYGCGILLNQQRCFCEPKYLGGGCSSDKRFLLFYFKEYDCTVSKVRVPCEEGSKCQLVPGKTNTYGCIKWNPDGTWEYGYSNVYAIRVKCLLLTSG